MESESEQVITTSEVTIVTSEIQVEREISIVESSTLETSEVHVTESKVVAGTSKRGRGYDEELVSNSYFISFFLSFFLRLPDPDNQFIC